MLIYFYENKKNNLVKKQLDPPRVKGTASLTVRAGSQAKRKVGKPTERGKQRKGKGSVKEENVVGCFYSWLF